MTDIRTSSASPARPRSGEVYLACPWGPFGGGMYKVADYLRQAQTLVPDAPRYRIIDSRGPTLIGSPLALMRALIQVAWGALSGHMSLLHVNMAQGLSVLRKGLLIHCARLFGAPAVLHLHAAKLPQFYAGCSGLSQWLMRWTFRRASCVIVLGDSARQFVIDVLQVPAGRVVKLTNGVPRPSAHVTRDTGSFNLLFLGSQFERKGLPDLLRGLARPVVKDLGWKLIVAGGDEAGPYIEEARRLGIADRVRFTGWVSQERAAELLSASDTMILPSYDEGLPLVILEALGCGVPVICTPVGEIPQFLTDGRDALFVPTRQPDRIAEAVASLIRDEGLRTRLVAKGRQLFDEQFSLEAFTRELAAIYRRYCGYADAAPPSKARLPQAE